METIESPAADLRWCPPGGLLPPRPVVLLTNARSTQAGIALQKPCNEGGAGLVLVAGPTVGGSLRSPSPPQRSHTVSLRSDFSVQTPPVSFFSSPACVCCPSNCHLNPWGASQNRLASVDLDLTHPLRPVALAIIPSLQTSRPSLHLIFRHPTYGTLDSDRRITTIHIPLLHLDTPRNP